MKIIEKSALTQTNDFHGNQQLPHHVDTRHVRPAGKNTGGPSKLLGISSDAEARWVFHAPVFGLWATLPERRKCAGAYGPGGGIFATGGEGTNFECDREAVRTDAVFFGKNAQAARGTNPTTLIFLEPVRSQHLTGSDFRREVV